MFYFRTILFILIISIYKSSFSNVNQERILKYLQNFESLRSDFIQVNNNGNVLTGKLFISRPGMVRIEYKEIPLLLISDSKKIASINQDLDSITFYRLQDIPVALLLYKDFKLEKLKVLDFIDFENQFKLKIKEKENENPGFIEIIFEKNTFTLKKWIIFRDKLNKTEVLLQNLKFNEKFNKKLFDIDSEDPRHPIWRNN
jgi:outer membrane lipoprotein-sorting protein